jgi:hypothetical protein
MDGLHLQSSATGSLQRQCQNRLRGVVVGMKLDSGSPVCNSEIYADVPCPAIFKQEAEVDFAFVDGCVVLVFFSLFWWLLHTELVHDFCKSVFLVVMALVVVLFVGYFWLLLYFCWYCWLLCCW